MVKRLAVLLLACSGCELLTESFATNDFSGDPFPIYVDTRSGAVLLGLESQGRRHVAVLDVLSPLTLIDPGADVQATIDFEDLTLLGDRAPDLGMPDLPRAAFDEQQVLRIHPCAADQAICKLGVPSRVEQEFDAIVGADSLAGDALRMRLGASEIFVLANIGGEDRDRTYACDALFPSPYRGGGTLIVADTEVPFAGRRPTVQVCLSPDPDSFKTQAARGTDALFVMSTSIGPSLLSESAYERYRETHPAAPPLSTIAEVQLSLPSGSISGRPIVIDKAALVARANSQPLAPCRQVYAHHLLAERDCFSDNVEDCPCEGDGQTFCPVPASVGITPAAGLEMFVVADDNATLQALRTEFRPSSQEIDGLLGTSAMKDVEIDVDYTHNRLLMRCSSGAPLCETRPALDEKKDRKQVRGCLGLP
jgi:hypothetical protein